MKIVQDEPKKIELPEEETKTVTEPVLPKGNAQLTIASVVNCGVEVQTKEEIMCGKTYG